MSRHESLGPIMMDLRGPAIDADEREMLLHPLVGGVILFTRNFVSIGQISQLCADIHALRTPHLLIAVDHEGGRVQRFRDGFTQVPAAGSVHRLYDRDPKRALTLAEDFGWVMASEVRACGIDISFAPVLDLDRGISQVIGNRGFHRDPEATAELGHAYMRGMRRAGMEATGKHFPGHGGVPEDSHLTLPVDPRRFADIEAEDLLVFERMIRYGLAAVMMAHVEYPAVDPQPAGFSEFWVRDVLRKRLGFQGVVFSDDLSMAGAEGVGGYADRARRVLEVGADMALICNHTEGVVEALEELQWESDPASHMRLARMHMRKPTTWPTLRANADWRDAVTRLAGLGEDDPTGQLPV